MKKKAMAPSSNTGFRRARAAPARFCGKAGLVLIAFLSLVILAAKVTAASRGDQVDLMQDFLSALSAPTSEARLSALKKSVIARAPDLYGPIIPVPDDAALMAYLDNATPMASDMRMLSAGISGQIPHSIALLRSDLGQILPMRIFVAPSLFTSNGQVRMSDQGPVVAFGPDVQAYAVRTLLKESPPFDVRPLVAHELFHAQHYGRNPEMAAIANRLFRADRPALLYNLWIEGLATCESMRLDGNASITDSLMSLELAQLDSAEVRRLARDIANRIDSVDEADYRAYFWLSGDRVNVPKRAGYLVGALVADHIIRNQGLGNAVRLKGAPLRKSVLGALAVIAAHKFQLNWTSVCVR